MNVKSLILIFELPNELQRFICKKGSIAIENAQLEEDAKIAKLNAFEEEEQRKQIEIQRQEIERRRQQILEMME